MQLVKITPEQADKLGLTSEIKSIYGLTGILCANLATAKFYCKLYNLPLNSIVDLHAK